MPDQDPVRDFIKNVQKQFDELVEEAHELDQHFRKGRVGDLIRKYNPKHSSGADEDGDGTDDDSGGTDDEGGARGPNVDPRTPPGEET